MCTSNIEHLCEALGHSDRNAGLVGYCQGLMLLLRRKSGSRWPLTLEPERVSARHQSLHHFVSKSEWSDAALHERVRRWVLPHMNPAHGLFWIIDDTGFPKQGQEFGGCGATILRAIRQAGHCQVAVSLSVATDNASSPVAYQLYLPREWSVRW